MLKTLGEHATEDTLELYAMGRLGEPEVEKLEVHLLVCDACRASLEASEDFARAMKKAAATLQNQKQTAGRWNWANLFGVQPQWAAAAAMFVLVVAGGVQWGRNRPLVGEPVGVRLVTARGNAAEATAAGGRPVTLSADLTELPPGAQYKLELVSASGKLVGAWLVTPQGGSVGTTVRNRLAAGPYFVRLYSETGDLLREYSLRIR